MIVADQRNRFVSDLLRGRQAGGFRHDLIHGTDIDQPGLVQSNRSLGAQDLQHRLIDARFGNLPASDRSQ